MLVLFVSVKSFIKSLHIHESKKAIEAWKQLGFNISKVTIHQELLQLLWECKKILDFQYVTFQKLQHIKNNYHFCENAKKKSLTFNMSKHDILWVCLKYSHVVIFTKGLGFLSHDYDYMVNNMTTWWANQYN